jgi:hypothetical protein
MNIISEIRIDLKKYLNTNLITPLLQKVASRIGNLKNHNLIGMGNQLPINDFRQLCPA